ncbi:MAG: hypothetical protein ACLF0G_08120 [Candidatus Brocadiia bacterium]
MRTAVPCALAILCCGLAAAQPQRHDRAVVVPAPGRVAVDGQLGEWDLSGAIECVFDQALRPRFTARLAFMYDAQAFYIAARFHDDTPLRNRHDPQVEPNRGWAGDCLQVRLCSDPQAPYPLPSSNSDRICHLTLWHYTDRREPVLHAQYGMDYHGTKVWTGEDSGLAFRAHPEGDGYTLEARVPWERLHAAKSPPKANDRLALVVQPLWSDASGWKQVCTFNDVVREAGFSFQGTAMWGQAVFSPTGHLAREERPRTVQEALQPLALGLPATDREAASVSAAVFDADGRLVRTLPVLTAGEGKAIDALGQGERPAVRWDGLDDDGRPLPPGDYRVKVLSHRGIGQRWVASLHNAGDPPWRTDDGTGSWGGDHGPPIAAASDPQRVYLGWTISEAGWAVVACEHQLTAEGKPQKLWGQHQVLDIGILVTAMASDGERLFVAQDGKRWGQKDPQSFTAGVVLWDAASGKPINFPFAKRALVVSQWEADLRPDRPPLWERVARGHVGPQDLGLNLVGLAVAGDALYASLFLEDQVVAFDWRTGEKLRTYPLERPAGLAVAPEGHLLAVSGRRVLRLDPASGQAEPVVREGLSSPWDVAPGPDGRLYVTDCGNAMQVKVFDRTGKPLGAIGKPGGRPWVGRYDPEGMLKPAGLTVDPAGKLWVSEHDSTPKRVSVWSREGRLLADLLGPGAYAVEALADPWKPQWVNCHDTLFEVRYATGERRVLATLTRPNLRGLQFGHDGGYMGRALKFRHLRDRVYVVHTGRGAVVVYRLRDDLVCEPLAAMGDTGHMRFHLPASLREELGLQPNHTIRWTDRNGDTFVQKDEIDTEPLRTTVRNYWGPWVDAELRLWNARGNEVFRVAPAQWLPSGAPRYPRTSEQEPLFAARGDRVHYVMPDGQSVYLLEQQGGGARGKGAEWQAISRYTLDGRRRWAYRRVWLGFGLEAPLARPGDVVGALKFIGKVHLGDDLALVAVNGYFGQFNILASNGLWVAALCKDNRYGPPAGPDTVWPENFSGAFFRNRDDGKVYLMAGDTDARIWEVTGLETLRTAAASFRISEQDHREALRVAMARQGVAPELEPIRLGKAPRVAVDGKLDDWDLGPAVAIEAGGGRGARVALAYDEKRLLAAFDVTDRSPMRNAGSDPALLFKTGDACDVTLATDPQADPQRTGPAAGDIRLLFATLDGQPVCVLYRPVVREGERAPRVLSSPVSAESFDFVGRLEGAEVALRRREGGYTLEAAVPLEAIGFQPRPGLITKADLGVIFSDPGGSRNVLRAYYANPHTAIVNDIPSEARLCPQHWGLLRVE